MTSIPSMVWTQKATKQILHIQFDEEDEIMAGIEATMLQHGIGEAKLEECKGHIKSGLGNYLSGSQLMTWNFNNTEVKNAVGHFKVSKKASMSVLKIIPTTMENHVTLAKAKAAADFEVKLSYYDFG